MNLLDDSTGRNLESTLETMTPAHDTQTGASAVLDAPESAQPSPAEPLASAPESRENDALQNAAPENDAPANDAAENAAPEASSQENAAVASDDFAAALHNFENQTEEAVSDDHVIKGTVVKLTATHVVVDIGAKSEGMVPIAEILDHEGKPSSSPAPRST